jgi:dephospho-CoA kinase
VETRLAEYQAQGKKAAFVEMGFIIEKSWMNRVDEVWVVKVPQEIILKRLQGRGITESEALARMANQTPPEETVKKGGLAKARLVLIDNTSNLDHLKVQVEKLWNKIDNK